MSLLLCRKVGTVGLFKVAATVYSSSNYLLATRRININNNISIRTNSSSSSGSGNSILSIISPKSSNSSKIIIGGNGRCLFSTTNENNKSSSSSSSSSPPSSSSDSEIDSTNNITSSNIPSTDTTATSSSSIAVDSSSSSSSSLVVDSSSSSAKKDSSGKGRGRKLLRHNKPSVSALQKKNQDRQLAGLLADEKNVKDQQVSFKRKAEFVASITSANPFLHSETGTLYAEKTTTLDDTPDFQPVVVEHKILEDRYQAYKKDVEEGKIVVKEKIPFGQYQLGKSRRCGVIGIKMKMMPFWDEYGNKCACTPIWVPNCQVIYPVQPSRASNYNWGMNVGSGYAKDSDSTHWPVSPAETAAARKQNIEAKAVCVTFDVTEDAMLPPGFRLSVRHFIPGQSVDVLTKSLGKGFAGVMKRWKFSGGPKSHGASLFHRRPGSIGMRKTRIMKGKKMAGHMGDDPVVTTNLYVHRIDFKNDLLYVKGSIGGSVGGSVFISDSRSTFSPNFLPPFPSFVPDEKEDLAALSFNECQMQAPSKYSYTLDFGFQKDVTKVSAVRAATKRQAK